MLVIRDLSKSFREGQRVHRVLEHADAEVASGEVVAIIGRSGSGKSTLLNLISGVDHPDGGTIEFDGRIVSALGEPGRTWFRRQHVGFVYQLFNLLPTLDVYLDSACVSARAVYTLAIWRRYAAEACRSELASIPSGTTAAAF